MALNSNQKTAWDVQKKLINNFAQKKVADALFPPLFDDSTTQQAIKRF